MRIYKDTLLQERSMFVGFCLIMSVFVVMLTLLYPGDEAAVEQLTGLSEMGDWEAAFGISYGKGGEYRLWLALLVFSYIGIVYVAIPALSGTALAKDVDKRTLDMLVSNPVGRRRILLERTLGVLTLSFLSVLFLFLLVLVLSWSIGQSINLGVLFAATVQVLFLMVFVSVLSIFFGVLFRDSNRARRYIGFIIMGSFVINMIVLMSEELEFLKYFQIFYYYDSASSLLKPNISKVEWDKSVYVLIFSVVLFFVTLLLNDRRDLVPHFSHRVEEKRKHDRGIPLLFYYVRSFQSNYPSFVEQIQSDRLIIYLFALLMGLSGLITPGMYPGDKAWVGLSKTYGGTAITGSILRDHGVALNFIGYIATEGFGEFFLYMGIAAVILGPKIVVRDQRSSTIDLLFSQPTSFRSVVAQRMVAVALEFFTLFALNYVCYIIGIYTSGIGAEYILVIGLGIFLTFVTCLLMTYILTLAAVVMRSTQRVTGVASMIYFGSLVLFMVSSTVDSLELVGKMMPFYWNDRVRILYEGNIKLVDVLTTLGSLLLMATVNFLSLRLIVDKEFTE